MSATTVPTVPATWPETSEFASVLKLVADANDAIDKLSVQMAQLSNVNTAPALRDGVEAPTFEQVGALRVFVDRVRLELSSIESAVDHVDQATTSAVLDRVQGDWDQTRWS